MPPFKWRAEHDLILAKEMLLIEPYRFKKRSKGSGKAWKKIAENLNSLQTAHFSVSQKAVRDRANLIVKNHKLKLREITKASGIDVPEPTELETTLDDIIEREKAAKRNYSRYRGSNKA